MAPFRHHTLCAEASFGTNPRAAGARTELGAIHIRIARSTNEVIGIPFRRRDTSSRGYRWIAHRGISPR